MILYICIVKSIMKQTFMCVYTFCAFILLLVLSFLHSCSLATSTRWSTSSGVGMAMFGTVLMLPCMYSSSCPSSYAISCQRRTLWGHASPTVSLWPCSSCASCSFSMWRKTWDQKSSWSAKWFVWVMFSFCRPHLVLFSDYLHWHSLPRSSSYNLYRDFTLVQTIFGYGK